MAKGRAENHKKRPMDVSARYNKRSQTPTTDDMRLETDDETRLPNSLKTLYRGLSIH